MCNKIPIADNIPASVFIGATFLNNDRCTFERKLYQIGVYCSFSFKFLCYIQIFAAWFQPVLKEKCHITFHKALRISNNCHINNAFTTAPHRLTFGFNDLWVAKRNPSSQYLKPRDPKKNKLRSIFISS